MFQVPCATKPGQRKPPCSNAAHKLLARVMICVLSPVAAHGQSSDFNPYQAVLDRMPLVEAEDRITKAYGQIGNRYSGIAQPYEGGPVLVLSMKESDGPSFFLFCEGKLSAFTAPITPATAAEILRPLIRERSDTTAYPSDDGVYFEALGRTLSVSYIGVGTKTSAVTAAYPYDVWVSYDVTSHCAGLKK